MWKSVLVQLIVASASFLVASVLLNVDWVFFRFAIVSFVLYQVFVYGLHGLARVDE